MTSHAPNTLFSHPETHHPHVASGSSQLDQPAWTDLFQEPPTAPRTSSEN